MISRHDLGIFTLALLPFSPAIAHADGDFSLGAMGIYSSSIYKDTDSDVSALPFVAYTGEHLYLKGPEVGYNLLPNRSYKNIGFGLAYDFAAFDPDDSDDENIQKLDDRDGSLMAIVQAKIGFFSAKLAQDVSNTHNGYYAQVKADYPIQLQRWRLLPSISYRYLSGQMSDYQFGVSSSESASTGGAIRAYDASSTSMTRLTLNSFYPISQSLTLNLSATYVKYNDNVLDSPIVEKDHKSMARAGIIYRF
ncbi:MipA/OmpV family protein [Marinomonas pollencensis]|uniref:Outer membrane protein n=1 Tax=Marinomonas pollencensis TaxID=491954 RepID=A0A3E0DTX2_9GAMM|nr:MipA/OmpV family protein [Marinomonas pollencensis]REG86993.1 outer membrane protein [Marinomonas pollencensis]